MADLKEISLVLGSGGARGLAHIGVIRALEEKSLRIRNIAGTSMGALIGGIYAADELDTFSKWVQQLERGDVIRLLDLSFSMTALFKGDRVIEVLKELIGDSRIEDLPIGFTAVATALREQREVWLNKGSLFDAIRASIAVPGVFTPATVAGQLLVDGGLVNPIPIAPTLNDATDLTIAVNLSGVSGHYHPQEEAQPARRDKVARGYRAAISQFVSGLLEDDDDEDGQGAPGFGDLLTQSFDVMQGSIARLKLAAYMPDIVIDVPRDACTFFEFYRADEMEELGYRKAREVLANYGL